MLRRRRDPLVLALRMLSSSSSSNSANPKPLLYLPSTSPIPRLSVFHHHHCSSFYFFRCLPRTQSMTISRCFFSGPSDLIPLSQNHEPGSNDPDSQSLVVVSFYKFADFPDHARLRTPLKELCQELRVSGGIILAPEGVNGSICGTRESVERVLVFIQSDSRLKGLRQVESPVSPEEEAIHHGHTSSSPLAAGEDAPFRWDHVRVKLKKEPINWFNKTFLDKYVVEE